MNVRKGEKANGYIKTSPNYVSRRTRFFSYYHHVRYHIPFVKVRPTISQIYLLTQYTVPGLLFLFLAMLPSKLCPIALSQTLNYTNGQCTGPLLALLSPLSMSQSGSLAGMLCFLMYQLASDSSQRVPFYWEVKTLFLLFLSLPQTQVSRLKLFLSDSCDVSLRVLGFDIYLHCTSSTVFLSKWAPFGRYPAQCAGFHTSKVSRFLDDSNSESAPGTSRNFNST